MSWQRQATEVILIAFIGMLSAWDLYAEATGPSATISEITIHLAYQHPAVPFLLGALMGHLTWPVVATRPHWITVAIVVGTIAVSVLVDRMGHLPALMPVLPLVVGLGYGHLAWPQAVSVELGQNLLSPASITTPHMSTSLTGVDGQASR